jgi:hypothetical protein
VGRGTGVCLDCGLDIAGCVLVEWEEEKGLVYCGLDIAGCVVVEWEEKMGLVYLWIGYSWLCIGRVRRVTGVGLVCGFVIASCVLLVWEERQC